MCGIVGVIQPDQLDIGALEGARDSLWHRGPDDASSWLSDDSRVGLAHRRLSILDLSEAGRQPFGDKESKVWLVYNGEIYNFLDLRRELESCGHRFWSNTDTEVVLRAYLQWGAESVKRLRGMFAYALWDARQRQLLLARDRLGIKPLYYYDGQCFAFASELGALLSLPGLDKSIDETAVYDFLTYSYVPAPKTPYRNVRKLLPGHYLLRKHERTCLHQYWDVDFSKNIHITSADAAVELLARLEECVRRHMIADVPVGCLLSGGIDSSTVAALAQRNTAEPLRTYCMGFDEQTHSETPYAQVVAHHLGSSYRESTAVLPQGNVGIARLVELYHEPFADYSAIPTLEVCRLARQEVTVALSGDGGDEVFGGYTSYTRHLARNHLRLLQWAPSSLLHWLEDSPGMRLRGVPTLIDAMRDPIERHVVIHGGLPRVWKEHLLSPQVMRRFRHYDDYWYFRQHNRPDLDLMSRMQYLDIKTYLPDDILTKVDRASMAVSLELRPPMLDHTLVEYVASLPTNVRNPNGELKHLLKRAVTDLLPREIIERPKQGFGVPNSWVRSWGVRRRRYRFGDHQDSLFSVLTEWMHKGNTGSLLGISI